MNAVNSVKLKTTLKPQNSTLASYVSHNHFPPQQTCYHSTIPQVTQILSA